MIHIFIINPFTGRMTFADDLRNKLKEIKGLDYFVFNSRHAGNETALVKKVMHIFEGEKLRIYSCGGSGTMRNVINGISNLDNTEVAFFPCGLTNDFIKIFGDNARRFENIEELINGDVIKIDYIKTNHGLALNTLSAGLDTKTVEKMNQYRNLRFISDQIPYMFGVLYSIFLSRPRELTVITDDNPPITGHFAEVFMGNGGVLGGNLYFGLDAKIRDGIAETRYIHDKYAFGLLPALVALMSKNRKKYDSFMTSGECQKMIIKSANGKPFNLNYDGEFVTDVTECEACIVKRGLNFVVPKGVRIE